MKYKVWEETTLDGRHLLHAAGPSPYDISKALHEKLNHDVEMEFARQLIALVWTPPEGHPLSRIEERESPSAVEK